MKTNFFFTMATLLVIFIGIGQAGAKVCDQFATANQQVLISAHPDAGSQLSQLCFTKIDDGGGGNSDLTFIDNSGNGNCNGLSLEMSGDGGTKLSTPDGGGPGIFLPIIDSDLVRQSFALQFSANDSGGGDSDLAFIDGGGRGCSITTASFFIRFCDGGGIRIFAPDSGGPGWANNNLECHQDKINIANWDGGGGFHGCT